MSSAVVIGLFARPVRGSVTLRRDCEVETISHKNPLPWYLLLYLIQTEASRKSSSDRTENRMLLQVTMTLYARALSEHLTINPARGSVNTLTLFYLRYLRIIN